MSLFLSRCGIIATSTYLSAAVGYLATRGTLYAHSNPRLIMMLTEESKTTLRLR